jgi:hypothetical protein
LVEAYNLRTWLPIPNAHGEGREENDESFQPLLLGLPGLHQHHQWLTTDNEDNRYLISSRNVIKTQVVFTL